MRDVKYMVRWKGYPIAGDETDWITEQEIEYAFSDPFRVVAVKSFSSL